MEILGLALPLCLGGSLALLPAHFDRVDFFLCLGGSGGSGLGLLLQLFGLAPDHKGGAHRGDAVGTGGFADGIADLPGRHEGSLQNFTLDQFLAFQKNLRLGDDAVGYAALAHHQGHFQRIGLGAKIGALFAG